MDDRSWFVLVIKTSVTLFASSMSFLIALIPLLLFSSEVINESNANFEIIDLISARRVFALSAIEYLAKVSSLFAD